MEHFGGAQKLRLFLNAAVKWVNMKKKHGNLRVTEICLKSTKIYDWMHCLKDGIKSRKVQNIIIWQNYLTILSNSKPSGNDKGVVLPRDDQH